MPAITAIVVILATLFPTQFGKLAPSGEALALILMQVSCSIALYVFFIINIALMFVFEAIIWQKTESCVWKYLNLEY